MANISSNIDGFFINVSDDGLGVCNGQSIFFKKQNMPEESLEALNRAVTLASLAFSMDLYVQIQNYVNDDCLKASYIQISKTPFS